MAVEQRTPDEIRQEAARWITERDAGLLSLKDQRLLSAWLDADPRHAEAYARLERSWAAMGGAPVKAAISERNVVPPFRLRPRAAPWLGGAIAACLAIVIVGSIQDWPTRLSADAATATGEQLDLPLADGSRVQLNTGSAIKIDYRADRRVIRLLKGEAAFIVAADRSRPFTVEAGKGATTALGTRFMVRRDGAGTDVTVTEHRVRVDWRAQDGFTQAVTVANGQSLRYGAGDVASAHYVDTDAASGWTRGRLVFVDRPLVEVVSELNRYHAGYIRVVGVHLAQRKVSGVFPTRDPIGALDAIQQSLGLNSTRFTDRLIFLHR